MDINTNAKENSVHKPLPKGRFIRYLVLEPASNEADLICSLHISPLDAIPYFEALSYVWGSDERNSEIRCNGEVIKITNNLQEALRRLRLDTEPRTLWADSICINQEDIYEKGCQVSMMGDIYRTANRVLIFVGSDDLGQGESAASLILELDAMILRKLRDLDPAWDNFPYPNAEYSDCILEDERWMAVSALCYRSWFNRGWVVQEAGLATDAAVIWGATEIPWKSLAVFWSGKAKGSPDSGMGMAASWVKYISVFLCSRTRVLRWHSPLEMALQTSLICPECCTFLGS